MSWRISRPSCSSRPRRGPIRGERYESLLVGNYLSNRSRPLHGRPDGFAIGIESEAEMEGPTTGLQMKRNFHRLRGSPPLKAGRFNMPSTSRFGIGLLFIAGAIGLHFLSFVFQYVGYLLPASVPGGQESFYLGLHTLWIPLSGPLLVGATAAVLIVGFLIVWRDRACLEPSQRAFMGLAGLGFAASVVGALIRTSLGVVLGFVYAPGLRGALGAVDVGFAIALGLTFYCLLLGVRRLQPSTAGVVALVIGSISSGLTVLWRTTPSDGGAGIGLTAGVFFLPPPLPRLP